MPPHEGAPGETRRSVVISARTNSTSVRKRVRGMDINLRFPDRRSSCSGRKAPIWWGWFKWWTRHYLRTSRVHPRVLAKGIDQFLQSDEENQQGVLGPFILVVTGCTFPSPMGVPFAWRVLRRGGRALHFQVFLRLLEGTRSLVSARLWEGSGSLETSRRLLHRVLTRDGPFSDLSWWQIQWLPLLVCRYCRLKFAGRCSWLNVQHKPLIRLLIFQISIN